MLFRLDSLLEHAELSRRGARRLERGGSEERLNASSHRGRRSDPGCRKQDSAPGAHTQSSTPASGVSCATPRELCDHTPLKKYLSTQRTHAHVHTTHDDDAHTHRDMSHGSRRAPRIVTAPPARAARDGASRQLSRQASRRTALHGRPSQPHKACTRFSPSRMTGHAAVDQFSIALCGSTSPDPSPSDPTLQPRGLQASPDLPNPTDSPRMRRLTPPPPSAAWPHCEHRSGGQNPCPRSRSLCLRGPCRCVSRDCPSSAEVHT